MIRKTALTIALLAAAFTPAGAQAAPAQAAFTRQEAQAAIWAKEQAIYGDRARGIIDTYIAATADDYAAWPPGFDRPLTVDDLRAARAGMAGKDQEVLSLEFVDMSLNGNTAVLYYRSHRTQLPTGEPANEIFEVTHVWIHSGEDWQLLGGLARDVSEQAAQ